MIPPLVSHIRKALSAGCTSRNFGRSEKDHAAQRGRDASGQRRASCASLSRRLSAFFGSAPPAKTQKRQSLPFYPPATQGFRNVWNAPRVVIPPPPRTIRKYCAQSEKTATSPSCKQITQPSGAATPRNSDAHKRIAVPKAFCVLWEHPRPSPKSGKTCRSDTRPGDVCERAERSEGSDTTPHPKRPVFRRVSRCVRSFSEDRVCTRFHPRKQTWAICARG